MSKELSTYDPTLKFDLGEIKRDYYEIEWGPSYEAKQFRIIQNAINKVANDLIVANDLMNEREGLNYAINVADVRYMMLTDAEEQRVLRKSLIVFGIADFTEKLRNEMRVRLGKILTSSAVTNETTINMP